MTFNQQIVIEKNLQMSSTDESVLYRLKNLIDHNVIAIHKNPFQIGRATSKSIK